MRRNLSQILKRNVALLRHSFANDPRVLGVFLFGSQADGRATPRSDIDLAVLFDRELDLKEELAFELAVSNALDTDDVDVVNLNRANLLFRFRAISGKLLYARDETRLADFAEETMIEYRDFEPRAQTAMREFFVTL